MPNNSSLYGSAPPSGTVSSSNYTTLYSGGNNFVPSGDNVIISGTLTVNGCSILTDCSTFNLLPFNATTINFGGSSTAMSIGGATGVTTIQNQLSTANYLFPLADGLANQVLITDGAGVLSFADVQSLDTNYNIQADTATGGANLTLVGSDATTDSVKFANGTNVTVSRTDASTITISSIDTNTTYTQNASATTGGANLNLVGSDATTDTIKFAQGAGITVVRTDADTITITNTDPGSAGVTSITGTANQVIASSPTGAVTLSLPQDIATISNPTFAGIIAGLVNIGVSPVPNNVIRTTAGSNADLVMFADGTGEIYLNDTTNIGTFLVFNGSTNGSTSITAPTTGSNINWVLPNAQGAVSTVLTNDGSGNLSWALPGGGGSTFGNITIAVDTDNTISTTTGDLILQTQAGVNSGVITIEAGAGNDIVVEPNGLGRVLLTTDQVVVGDLNTSVAITTNGTGNLYFNTNGSVNSGSMYLEAGVNGNIVLAPYATGSGAVKTYNDFIVDDDVLFVDVSAKRIGINNTVPDFELHIDNGSDTLTQFGMTNNERTFIISNNGADDLLSLYYGVLPPAGDNRLQFNLTDQWFNTGRLGVGTTTPAYNLDVAGDGRFTSDLQATNSLTVNGLTSGSTSLIQVDGSAVVDYYLPTAQGANATVLTNDGFGNLSWALPGGGGSTFGNITVGVVTDNTISTTTGDLVLASFTNLLDAATLSANFNNVSVDNQADLDSSTLTTTSTATVALNTTTRNAMTGLINIIQGSNVHCLNYTMVKIDATTAMLTTYAEMYNNISLGSFTADVSAGSLRLLVTPTSATSTVFSVVRTSLT